ncbi:MAG: HAMP domain-containing protein [Verrucomicrobia bacterium]|nr:HAMP domain-containing protein [Verrucomicrobiota bacterium]
MSGATLLALTEVNRRAVERLLREQAEVQAMQSTLGVVDGLDAVLGAAERLARTVARDLEGRPLTTAEVQRTASNLMLDQAGVAGFSIAFEPRLLDAAVERSGFYVHRSRVANRFVTRDLAAPDQAYWNRDWYREVIDKGLPVWSEPFFDQGGVERNVVRIAVPMVRTVNDRRVPVGAVSAVIELDWLRRLANASEFSDTSYAIVFSRTGKLIIHPNPNYVIAETIETLAERENAPELAAIRQHILAKRQGALSYVEPIRGRRVHVNYKPSKVAGWGVIIGYDEAEFLKHQRAFRRIAAAYLGASLLLLAGIVIGVTRRALRPLAPLAASADEIAQRNLDCTIPAVVRDDEIGRLTRSFRAMRDALKAQHAERRWAAQSLEHQLKYNNLIIDSIGELVFVITKGRNIARINPAVTRAAGYTPKEVVKTPVGRVLRLASDPSAAGDALAEAVTLGASLVNQPAVVIAKDGTRLRATLTVVPLQDGGQVVGAVATLRLDSVPQPRAT